MEVDYRMQPLEREFFSTRRTEAGRRPQRSGGLHLNQSQFRGRVEHAMKMSRRFGENDLERRAHLRLKEVPAVRGAIGFSDDDVNVDFGFAVRVRADVAEKRKDLDLFVNGDLAIVFGLPVEPAKNNAAECADGGELAAAQVVGLCKTFQPPYRFVAGVEYDGPGAGAGEVV